MNDIDLSPDERAVAAVLVEHGVAAFNGTDTACLCDRTWRTNSAYRLHLAGRLAPLLAACRVLGVEDADGVSA